MSDADADTATPERALWIAVLDQVRTDIAGAPLGSLEYQSAEDFLLDGGSWGQSREEVADCIGIHADDIARAGYQWVEARRRAENLPGGRRPVFSTFPKPVPPVRKITPPPPMARRRPWPRLIALPAPPPAPVVRKPHRTSQGRRWVFNPNNPLLLHRR